MSQDRLTNNIRFTLWPATSPGKLSPNWEVLTRDAAIERYGLTTIEAMETVLVLNPSQSGKLEGKADELVIDFVREPGQP